MSSMVRRIQKNIARGMGFYRDRETGMIHDQNGDSTGSSLWPKVSYPTKTKKEA